jgi:hypothetical protein
VWILGWPAVQQHSGSQPGVLVDGREQFPVQGDRSGQERAAVQVDDCVAAVALPEPGNGDSLNRLLGHRDTCSDHSGRPGLAGRAQYMGAQPQW